MAPPKTRLGSWFLPPSLPCLFCSPRSCFCLHPKPCATETTLAKVTEPHFANSKGDALSSSQQYYCCTIDHLSSKPWLFLASGHHALLVLFPPHYPLFGFLYLLIFLDPGLSPRPSSPSISMALRAKCLLVIYHIEIFGELLSRVFKYLLLYPCGYSISISTLTKPRPYTQSSAPSPHPLHCNHSFLNEWYY